MRSFFHGWRRRIGCATLILALAAMGMWIRTFHVDDDLWISPSSHLTYTIKSKDSRVVLQEWQRPSDSTAVSFRSQPPSKLDTLLMGEVDWRWEWHGFAFGDHDSLGVRLWTVPYWSIVLSLTLLSACLILPQAHHTPKRESRQSVAEL